MDMIRPLCTLIFRLGGWRYVSQIPDDLKSFVFIGAPHTSNHDILPTIAITRYMKRNARFVIKSQWLKFPFGPLFRSVGAIGVDREKIQKTGKANTTELMADLFKKHKDLVLMISPEGTRRATDDWKSGFYYIASKAGVPIVLGYADYAKKEAGLAEVIYPKNYAEDMKRINDFYRNVQPKHPHNFLLNTNHLRRSK